MFTVKYLDKESTFLTLDDALRFASALLKRARVTIAQLFHEGEYWGSLEFQVETRELVLTNND